MSQNGNDRSHLRIGGWLPGATRPGAEPARPAPDRPDAGMRQHRSTNSAQWTTAWPPATSVAPSVSRHTGASVEVDRAVALLPVTGAPAAGQIIDRADPRRTHLLGGVALAVITVLIGVMALRDGNPQGPIRGEFVAGVPHPDRAADDPANGGLVPVTDGTGSDPRGVGATSPGPTSDPVVRPGLNPRIGGGGVVDPDSGPASPSSPPANPATKAPAPPPAPSAPAAPSAAPVSPAGPVLAPGTRIGLEVAGRPGHRVRHANFEARVDPVNAGSSAGTKADATFVVRSGLAGSSCVSFESVNFPGHYLRHSGFRVFLHRADGSALFRADATFCPVTGIGGTHTSLRSHNFPDRYLSHDPRNQMRIAPVGDGAAPPTATFLIRPPL